MKPVVLHESTKAVLFDHDDTLVATIQAKWAQHKFIAKTFYDKNLKDEKIRLHWGKPLTVLIKLLYETDNIDMAMSYNLATYDRFPKVLFDDTAKTLAALRKEGKKIGLVTSTTRLSLENDFKILNIPKRLFDHIQTEDDTLFHKPDPRVFEPAIAWLREEGIRPGEVAYVGDSFNDMKAALGAGFQFIGVSTGLISAEEFEKQNVKGIHRIGDLLSSYTETT